MKCVLALGVWEMPGLLLWAAATKGGGGERLARPQGCEWPTTSPGDVRQEARERLIHRPGCKLLHCLSDSIRTNPEVKLLRISGQWPQGIQLQALALLSTETWRIIPIPCS